MLLEDKTGLFSFKKTCLQNNVKFLFATTGLPKWIFAYKTFEYTRVLDQRVISHDGTHEI